MEQIAQSFTDYYYATFDGERAQLGPLYVSCGRAGGNGSR